MNSPKLKPCPACGSSAELYAGDVPQYGRICFLFQQEKSYDDDSTPNL